MWKLRRPNTDLGYYRVHYRVRRLRGLRTHLPECWVTLEEGRRPQIPQSVESPGQLIVRKALADRLPPPARDKLSRLQDVRRSSCKFHRKSGPRSRYGSGRPGNVVRRSEKTLASR